MLAGRSSERAGLPCASLGLLAAAPCGVGDAWCTGYCSAACRAGCGSDACRMGALPEPEPGRRGDASGDWPALLPCPARGEVLGLVDTFQGWRSGGSEGRGMGAAVVDASVGLLCAWRGVGGMAGDSARMSDRPDGWRTGGADAELLLGLAVGGAAVVGLEVPGPTSDVDTSRDGAAGSLAHCLPDEDREARACGKPQTGGPEGTARTGNNVRHLQAYLSAP